MNGDFYDRLRLGPQPRNRRLAHVITARQLLQRGSFSPALPGLVLLLRGEGGGGSRVAPRLKRHFFSPIEMSPRPQWKTTPFNGGPAGFRLTTTTGATCFVGAPVTRLALGVAQRRLAFRNMASGHHPSPLRNVEQADQPGAAQHAPAARKVDMTPAPRIRSAFQFG